jgi:hypothetical protein
MTIDADTEAIADFMAKHGRLYRALRPLVVALVQAELPGEETTDRDKPDQGESPASIDIHAGKIAVPEDPNTDAPNTDAPNTDAPGNGELEDETAENLRIMSALAASPPSRPGRPGPRSDSGIPFYDSRMFDWLRRRTLAKKHGQEFTEPCPYYWD